MSPSLPLPLCCISPGGNKMSYSTLSHIFPLHIPTSGHQLLKLWNCWIKCTLIKDHTSKLLSKSETNRSSKLKHSMSNKLNDDMVPNGCTNYYLIDLWQRWSWKKTQETDSSDYWRARWFPRFSLTLIAVNLDNQLARSVRQKGGTNQAAPAYRLDLNSQVWVSWQENPKT